MLVFKQLFTVLSVLFHYYTVCAIYKEEPLFTKYVNPYCSSITLYPGDVKDPKHYGRTEVSMETKLLSIFTQAFRWGWR